MQFGKISVFVVFVLTMSFACEDKNVIRIDSRTTMDQSPSMDVAQKVDLEPSDLMNSSDVGADRSSDLQMADVPDVPDVPDAEMGPKKIDDLTIIVKTADIENAGTSDAIEICLNDNLCFPFAVEDVATNYLLGRNSTSVIHVRDLDILESDVSRVELRTKSLVPEDSNAWIPQCVALRFNGQPRYCNNQIDTLIGIGSERESMSWVDPKGIHENCLTCEDSVIPQGPILGALTQTTAKFWIRSDASRPLQLRIGERPDLVGGVVRHKAIPDSAKDYVNKIQIEGLRPGTQYFYRFEVEGGFNTDVFSFKTLERFSEDKTAEFVMGSCTSRVDDQPAFERIADLRPRPDLFIFGGDTHYANSFRRDAQSIHWQRMRRAEGQSRVMANIPTISTWDDHDFTGNNSGGTCEGIDEATRSFVDSWANPDVDISKGIYYKHRVGPAEIFMLDCRTHRPEVPEEDNNRCLLSPTPPVLSTDDGMLGAEQNEWLLDELDASKAPFKFVLCGSQWNPEGSYDSWKSFPVAQAYLFSELDRRNINGVVLLDGDVHRSEFADVPRDSGYVLPVLTSSNLAKTVRSSGTTVCDAERKLRTFCYPDQNYMSISIDAEQEPAKLVAKVVDEFGSVVGERTIFEDELRGPGVARKIEVKVHTKDQENAGTSDPVEVCLGTHCFSLNQSGLTRNGVSTLSLSDMRIPLGSVNEVSLKTSSAPGSDNNAWLPSCLEIEINNQVKYCVDEIDTWIGTGNANGELEKWLDPMGLHLKCSSCP